MEWKHDLYERSQEIIQTDLQLMKTEGNIFGDATVFKIRLNESLLIPVGENSGVQPP